MTNKEQKSYNKKGSFAAIGGRFLYDKVSWYINAASFILLIACYFLIFYKKDTVLFPPSQNEIQVNFYNDEVEDQGQSILTETIDCDTIIGIECILKKGFTFPYAGLEIVSKKPAYLDVSDYNYLQVEVSSHDIEHLSVYLVVPDEHVKDTLHRLNLRRLNADLNVNEHRQVLRIKLSDFETPNWWYALINQSKSDFSDPALDKLINVAFSTGVNPNLGQPCSFAIYKVRFYKDNTWVLVGMLVIQILVMSITLFVFYQRTGRYILSTPVYVNYKAIDIKQPSENRSEYAFLDYIHENYMDPDLNLIQISKQVGVNQRYISDAVAQKFNCNIKTYINQIRIMESKRLLKKSDLKVSEIAYKVGFNSPANFNRVFKTLTGMSPSEFVQNNDR